MYREKLGRGAVAWVLVGPGTAGAAGALAGRGSHVLAGSSSTTRIIGACMLSSPGPWQRLLMMFMSGRTLMATDDQHPTRSPMPGSWSETSDGQLLTHHSSFLFDT